MLSGYPTELLLSGEASAVGIHTNSVPHLKVQLVKRFSAGLKKIIAQFRKCNCSEGKEAHTAAQ
jgi:hypothetical protein